MNPEGWVFIVDRKKDMINASGYKVWPREVEDVLAEHPAVRESAVVGVPDEKRGETVKAFVSLKPGATVTPEELIAHCKERMAAYKYPRQRRDRRRAAQDGHRQDPAPGAARPVSRPAHRRPAPDGGVRDAARRMTTPADPETPQPRDIALEQETPELADDLDQQSDPDPRARLDVS